MKKQENGQYPVEFRVWAVEQLKAGVSIGALSKQTKVHRTLLHRWKKNPIHPNSQRGKAKPPKAPGELSLQEELQQVKQLLADKTLEVHFLKGALQRIEA
jgi:transposase-like protein